MGEIISRLLVVIYIIVMSFLHHIIFIYTCFKYWKKNNLKNLEKFGLYKVVDELKARIINKEVWCFNCASAGEANAIKKLLTSLYRTDRFMVVTTSTTSGLKIITDYSQTNNNVIPIYVPYDTPQAINRFLNFWKPKKIVLVESEIWPYLILKGSKIAKVSIINARLSPRSFKRWSRVSWLLKYILKNVSFIAASSQSDFNHYNKFYPEVVLTGNLKYDSDPLYCNPIDLKKMQESIGSRRVFVCASTHPSEEIVLIKVYKRLLELMPDLLLLLIPRHIERGEELSQMCFSNKLISILRIQNDTLNNHVPADTNVYIINTMGEMRLAFRLGRIVFMGGSIIDIGGHNCCEPAMLECAIMSGANMSNFIDLMDSMIQSEALIIASTEDEIFENAKRLFSSPNEVERLGKNAIRFVKENSGALNKIIKLLEIL